MHIFKIWKGSLWIFILEGRINSLYGPWRFFFFNHRYTLHYIIGGDSTQNPFLDCG